MKLFPVLLRSLTPAVRGPGFLKGTMAGTLRRDEGLLCWKYALEAIII